MILRPGLPRKFVFFACFVAPVLGLLTAAAARPAPAELIAFTAIPAADHIIVEWTSATEIDIAAFSLHRAESPQPSDWGVPVYEVPAGGSVTGAAYRYVDAAVTPGVRYFYLLRDISITGAVTEHGPIAGTVAFLCDGVTGIPVSECEALVELYKQTNGPGWMRRDGWLATSTPCSWYGVTCRAGRVREINLSCNNVSGELPAKLRNLARLEALSLAGGSAVFTESGRVELVECGGERLSGPIPPELGQLFYLERLDLTLNRLTGTIPPELGNFSYLRALALGGNRLSGSIPLELGHLTNLERLDLTDNDLTGPVLVRPGFIYNLERLDLRGNRLEGEIPFHLLNLNNLRYVDLSSNRLTGPISSGLGELAQLRRLDVSGNQLSGTLPDRLADAFNLESLLVRDNPLRGPLPRSLRSLDLREFDFASTQLCEPPDAAFQDWLARIPALARTGALCRVAYLPLAYTSVPAQVVFWASRYIVPPGGCAALEWDVANAREVYLDGVPVAGRDWRGVCPAGTTSYTLSVTYANGYHTAYVVTITVTDGPWVGVDDDGNFYRGNPGAVVKMEEFMDFECPFCARHARETGPQIDTWYIAKGEVVEVFRNFPLSFHPNSRSAAAAAFCAGQQDPALFWTMRDWLFANQILWGRASDPPAQFRSAALAGGADAGQYDTCIASPAPAARIERDLKEGADRGVRGIPTFFLNNWQISGAQPYQVFAGAIENLKRGLPPPPTPSPWPTTPASGE